MALNHVTLEDKYDLGKSRIFVTGFQALVRLCLMQKERDRRAGLDTAGYVTGYRGSPLGTLDQQFIRAQRHLDRYDIRFQAGINEDIAATAIWGSQQAELRGEGKFDGVFGLWYGKGPGVDRTGDVFRHANFAGTSRHGGVLALMGDDHTAESSTTAHQSEYHFIDVMIPILNPAGVQEILDYGLYGWAMSRFCGSWVALKSMHETVESTAVIDGSLERVNIVIPEDFAMPEGGLNIRLRDTVLGQEARLHDYKRDAMLAFVRANKLNKYITSGGRRPKIGIITVGKSYLDVRQALDELGIDEVKCNDLGIRLYKIACPWPISRQDLKDFADGLELIIVVEEKRSLIEVQVREELYGNASQPVCIGKKDEQGNWLFPVKGALDPNEVAICIGDRILARIGPNPEIAARVAALERCPAHPGARRRTSRCARPISARAARTIHRRSCRRGCAPMPASAAITWRSGWTARRSASPRWAGRAPTGSARRRSASVRTCSRTSATAPTTIPAIMAIRGAIAAGVNITYKLLFNDAVAMTGGQPNDGGLTVPQIARQVAAEGATRVVVVTDEPWKYSKSEAWPKGLTIHHRDDLMAVQQELATIPGVTVLIYDQTCAAEKRRRRKRGRFPDPDKRVIINELVCEGCGDCGVKSNCVSVQPLETEWGRKRTIDQSSCNKDFSCVKGFCPSFVTVEGAKLKQGSTVAALSDHPPLKGEVTPLQEEAALPEPRCPRSGRPTISSSPASAAPGSSPSAASSGWRLISKARASACSTWRGSRRRAARSTATCASPPGRRISTPSASRPAAPISCSAATSWWPATRRCSPRSSMATTAMVINLAEFLPGDFTRNADFSLPTERLKRAIIADAGREKTHFVDATRAANCAVRQQRRRQYFPRRLCLSARRHPARRRVDRAGDRAQRRGRRDEQGCLPLGPPRRHRSRRARGVDRAGAGGDQ